MLNSRIIQDPLPELPKFAGSYWSETANFLSADECQSIIDFAKANEMQWGTTVGYNQDTEEAEENEIPDDRIVKMMGLPEEGFEWFYDRLSSEVVLINNLFWNFDIRGLFSDASILHYKVFEDGRQGKYDWHMDASGTGIRRRKISTIIQLSDPRDYEGCELQIKAAEDKTVYANDRGTLITFPSNVFHRVTPIESGERWSLVLWVEGPPFR